MVKLPTRDLTNIKTVGIPRGLLYHRYGTLWSTFFKALGCTVVESAPTDRAIVERGTALSVDECCLASKAYLGHVASLANRCDAVFVPCYASLDARAGFCTKFQSLPDLVSNTFRNQGLRVISLLVENISKPREVERAFVALALRMGATPARAKRAYKAGMQAQRAVDEQRATAQEQVVRALAKRRAECRKAKASAPATDAPLAILLVAHPYLAHDHFMGGAVVEAIEALEAVILYADETDHDRAFKASRDFSTTLPWVINRELIGSILLLQEHIDGIVLMSAFPCGPDSMTDDAIMRCIQGTPILNLTIDAQSGTAGVETRVESFIDILRFKRQGGYVHV